MSFLGKWFKSSKAYWPTPTRWAMLASFPLIPIVILLHILLLSRGQYIAWPENFVWPYLSSKGLVLYRDIFFIYPPFYFFLLSIWDKIAGISLPSLQAFSYLVIVATDFLLYRAAKKKIWPVLIYVPMQIFFEGNGVWPDQLLAPIFLFCYLAFKNKSFLLLGIFLGLALATKQTAAYFVLVLGAASFGNWRKVLAGAVISLGPVLLHLIQTKALSAFFQETWVYILSYHAGNQLQQLWPTIRQTILLLMLFFPPITIGIWKKQYLLVALTIAGGLGIFTRFSYFHLQPALPFLVLMIATSRLNLLTYFIVMVLFVKTFASTFGSEPRFLTKEVVNNAQKINSFLPPESRTLIMTSYDHYYWLTGTVPVGNFFGSSIPWNFNYPGVQERIVDNLNQEKPKFVVLGSCFEAKERCYQPQAIASYVSTHYRLVSKLSDGTGIFEYDPMSPR